MSQHQRLHQITIRFLGTSYTFTDPPQIYVTVPYMETDRDEGGSCKRLKDRFADVKTAQRIGLLSVFLIRKPFLCQSVAGP